MTTAPFGPSAGLRTADTEPLRVSFRAMGCRSHVVIHGGHRDMLVVAEQRIRELESLWSRFLATSEITIANRQAGRPVVVHDDTLAVVARSILGWRQTAGLFDITVLPRLLDHGYTHSTVTGMRAPAVPGRASGRADAIGLDFGARTLTVPADAAIDLGGIGKGFAADIVAEDLIEAGAAGVLVNIGGDLVALGEPVPDDSWYLGIGDPARAASHVATLRLAHGGAATSGTTVRNWTTAAGSRAHHLIDPLSGAPSAAGLATVTVIAGDAASAEVFATAAMMLDGESAMAMLAENGLAGLGITHDGRVHRTTTFAQFEVDIR